MLTSVRALPQVLLHVQAAAAASASFATAAGKGAKNASKTDKATPASVVVQKDWKAVTVPAEAISRIPTITVEPGQAFPGDIRSTSGLGMGDGLTSHTDKWLQVRVEWFDGFWNTVNCPCVLFVRC